jgi:hypothetical protein
MLFLLLGGLKISIQPGKAQIGGLVGRASIRRDRSSALRVRTTA